MDENKNIIDDTAIKDTETGTENTDAKEAVQENPEEQIIMATDENGNYYPSTYTVYGMAIGVAVGAVLMNMTDSKLVLSLCVLIGTVVGYFIKKKEPQEGDSDEK